jgi:hypothetical protein
VEIKGADGLFYIYGSNEVGPDDLPVAIEFCRPCRHRPENLTTGLGNCSPNSSIWPARSDQPVTGSAANIGTTTGATAAHPRPSPSVSVSVVPDGPPPLSRPVPRPG